MEDHTKGTAFLLKWHIQGWWVGPQLIDDTYSNNVSITVACWVDFNTWRWFACVQASHFRFRAARENAQTSHARERRSELQERARKQAARENRRASYTKERASERPKERAQESHEKERASISPKQKACSQATMWFKDYKSTPTCWQLSIWQGSTLLLFQDQHTSCMRIRLIHLPEKSHYYATCCGSPRSYGKLEPLLSHPICLCTSWQYL